jgi:cell division protein FtsB
MNRKKKYFIPILIALLCLMYQAMPLHKLFVDYDSVTFSISEEDDSTEKENPTSKKLKSEVDDYFSENQIASIFFPLKATEVYYFHHLPKSYEVKAVFAPPPELV